jgi:hypothetical protein
VNLFTPLWLTWGALFLVFEFTALWARRTSRYTHNGTLSALVWRFIEGHPIRRVFVAVGMLTLLSHFMFHVP